MQHKDLNSDTHNGHGHTHLHDPVALADAARGVLDKSGERWTDMRAIVYDVLAEFTTPASAYDIADKVSARRGKRIAPNSIYRILDLFVANNLAKRVEVANAFVVNSHPGCVHDCIFLVCDECGEVTHLDNDSLSTQVRAAAATAGFQPARPIIELTGLCAQCRA